MILNKLEYLYLTDCNFSPDDYGEEELLEQFPNLTKEAIEDGHALDYIEGTIQWVTPDIIESAYLGSTLYKSTVFVKGDKFYRLKYIELVGVCQTDIWNKFQENIEVIEVFPVKKEIITYLSKDEMETTKI